MEPVLLVFNHEGVLIHAGEHKNFSEADIINYASFNCTLTTVSIDEYRRLGLKLYKSKIQINFNQ